MGSQPRVKGHIAPVCRTPLPVTSSWLTQCPTHLMRPFGATQPSSAARAFALSPLANTLPMTPQPAASSAESLSRLFRPHKWILT